MRNEVAGSRASRNAGEASSSNANRIRLKMNQNGNIDDAGYHTPVGNNQRIVDTMNRLNVIESNVIDLTEEPELEVLSSTVRPTPRKFVAKKRRRDEMVAGNGDSSGRLVLESHRLDQCDTPVLPPKEPEKKNPVCGICLEAMGTNTERPMMAGNCGHVYCRDCLKQAVKRTRQCPSCRKGVTPKQIRNIFIDFD